MKKLLAIILSVATALCFVSCNGDTVTESDASSATDSTAPVESTGSTENTNSTESTPNDVPPASTVAGAGATTEGISVSDVDGDGVIRIACVGDSITGGNPGSNYPEFLQEYLDYLSTIDGKTYEVTNHGKGGAAVRHYLEELSDGFTDGLQVKDDDGDGKVTAYFYYDDYRYLTSLDYVADVVIVQMGTNDSLGGNWDAFDTYFKNDYYEYLIKPYKDKGSNVIISTAPWSYQYTNINEKIYDTILEIANEHNLPVVDTNRLMTDMYEVFDGVHCYKSGYKVMAQNFFKYIFGGELLAATVKTVPDASVKFHDIDSGEDYSIGADENGIAKFYFIPGKTYNFTCSAACTGYKASFEVPYVLEKEGDFVEIMLQEGQNVAIKGTAFAEASSDYYDDRHVPSSIIDGNKDTAVGFQVKSHTNGDTVGVVFDKAYTVDTILLYWESGDSIKAYNEGGYQVYFEVDGEWVAISDVTFSRANIGATSDTITFETPVENATAVKVVFLSSPGKAPPKLNEIEVF